MLICGLKLTHDSTISLLEDGKLLFSIELEKVNNNNRYKIMQDLSEIEVILKNNGYSVLDIDQFVIDGWVGVEKAIIRTRNLDKNMQIKVAPYLDRAETDDILLALSGVFQIGDHHLPYC